MAQRPVSIEDIAEQAGVSHATVSRALQNSPLISADVKERIQRLARELGYTPNAIAQSLKVRRTKAIGLVLTSISDPFVGRVVRGIEDVAHRANMSVFLSVSYNDPEREMAVIDTFQRRRVDGIISAAARISGGYAEQLARTFVPTVLINQQAEAGSGMLHSVEVDDYQGARAAVSHLLELGHTRIAYIGTGSRPWSNRHRLAGYRDALAGAGIEPGETWIRISAAERGSHTDDVADGQSLLPALLDAGVSALFCYNDMIAVGALLACRELGVPVPGRLSVVGFDDIETAQYVTPPLTTIHQPRLRLGQLAMEMLLDLLEGRPVENHFLPTELIRRSSAAAPAVRESDESENNRECRMSNVECRSLQVEG